MEELETEIVFRWVDGDHPDFVTCSESLEAFLNAAAGGAEKRRAFAPLNALEGIHDVLLAYDQETVAGCACLKPYDGEALLVKRVWVFPEYRGRHIARRLLARLEQRAKEQGRSALLLQTRRECCAAERLYQSAGFERVENFPPYEGLKEALCYRKALKKA